MIFGEYLDNDRFGSAAGGLVTNAAAHDDCIIALVEGEFTAFMSCRGRRPALHESGDLAFQRGDNGDLRQVQNSENCEKAFKRKDR